MNVESQWSSCEQTKGVGKVTISRIHHDKAMSLTGIFSKDNMMEVMHLLNKCLLSACMPEILPQIRQRPGFYGTYILVGKEGAWLVTIFVLHFF